MKTKTLLAKLAKRFPKKYAKQNHDFVGLMAGKLPEDVNRIFICLDFDDEIFEEAKNFKPDLILTHHPFIFGKKRNVLKYDENKRALYEKVEAAGLTIYSMHTNFDTGRGGMNDALAKALKLNNIYSPEKDIMMRLGELEQPMDVYDFAKFAKKALNVDYGLLIDQGHKTIQKVGIIGGGGAFSWRIAYDEGADIYISGDVRHHTRREIHLQHFNYLDLPHEIENIFMPTMKELLLEMDSNLDIKTVVHEKLPIVI